MMSTRAQLFLGAIVSLLVPICPTQAQDTCTTAGLPLQAQTSLKSKYSDWRPKRVSDLGADDKQIWSQDHPDECPGIAVGHFEKPDRVAYALLLVPKTELNHGYRIIVLSQVAASEPYNLRVLEQNDNKIETGSGLVISKAPPGSYSEFEDSASVQLKLDAVNVQWIEKGALLYYWSNGKYRTIQTED